MRQCTLQDNTRCNDKRQVPLRQPYSPDPSKSLDLGSLHPNDRCKATLPAWARIRHLSFIPQNSEYIWSPVQIGNGAYWCCPTWLTPLYSFNTRNLIHFQLTAMQETKNLQGFKIAHNFMYIPMVAICETSWHRLNAALMWASALVISLFAFLSLSLFNWGGDIFVTLLILSN